MGMRARLIAFPTPVSFFLLHVQFSATLCGAASYGEQGIASHTDGEQRSGLYYYSPVAVDTFSSDAFADESKTVSELVPQTQDPIGEGMAMKLQETQEGNRPHDQTVVAGSEGPQQSMSGVSPISMSIMATPADRAYQGSRPPSPFMNNMANRSADDDLCYGFDKPRRAHEALKYLEQCAMELQLFRARTKQMHAASKTANDRYVSRFKDAFQVLKRFFALQHLEKAWNNGQKTAMETLLKKVDSIDNAVNALCEPHCEGVQSQSSLTDQHQSQNLTGNFAKNAAEQSEIRSGDASRDGRITARTGDGAYRDDAEDFEHTEGTAQNRTIGKTSAPISFVESPDAVAANSADSYMATAGTLHANGAAAEVEGSSSASPAW